jgi:hypothetical protein
LRQIQTDRQTDINSCELKALLGESEGKRPLGRYRFRWEENFKIDLKEMGWLNMRWINLAQDMDKWLAVVKAVMNRHAPQNVGNFLTT